MKEHPTNLTSNPRSASRYAALAIAAAVWLAMLTAPLAAQDRRPGSTRLAQAPTPAPQGEGPSFPLEAASALGRMLSSGNVFGSGEATTTEPLPAPSEAVPPSPRTGFTIPLAETGDQSAIRVSDNQGMISLAVRDAPLRHVLSAIADARNLNLVFASSTDVPVTATLDRVPINQALDSLLSASGYTWAQSGRVIYVTSLSGAEALPPSVQGRRVAVVELDFAAATDIDQAVKGLLSPVGQSWVLEAASGDNRRTTNSIVIEDLDVYVARIEDYIAQADQPPRQVLIEAHLLQVDLDRNQRAGVDMQAIARLSGARISLNSLGFGSRTAMPGFFIDATGGDLSPVIEALISTTDAKTLASPRILAVNGQESRIQIGEQLGFRVTTTTQTSTLESVEFLDVGVVLTVTPRITRDGRVVMRIKPEVSSGAVDPNTGLPEEETTELETDVLLTSGQGMVLGGLIQERDSTVISKVPLLGSVPYAGFFFQRRQVIKNRSEIIVALVPHVLPYTPSQKIRNDQEIARVSDPLLYGPLCRYPRPYEPRLTDAVAEHPPWMCMHDEKCCGPPVLPAWSMPRRLPPIDCEEGCEECIPELTLRPLRSQLR